MEPWRCRAAEGPNPTRSSRMRCDGLALPVKDASGFVRTVLSRSAASIRLRCRRPYVQSQSQSQSWSRSQPHRAPFRYTAMHAVAPPRHSRQVRCRAPICNRAAAAKQCEREKCAPPLCQALLRAALNHGYRGGIETRASERCCWGPCQSLVIYRLPFPRLSRQALGQAFRRVLRQAFRRAFRRALRQAFVDTVYMYGCHSRFAVCDGTREELPSEQALRTCFALPHAVTAL